MSELEILYNALGPTAQGVLLQFARRLQAGTEYGDFDRDRKWPEEALQEALDGFAYIAVALGKLRGLQ